MPVYIGDKEPSFDWIGVGDPESNFIGEGTFYPASGPTLPLPANILQQFEARDSASVFTDDAGTNAAGNLDTIGRWNDISGNGFDLIQPTAGNRPILFEPSPGIWRISSDGSNDALYRSENAGLYSAGACTSMIVVLAPNIGADDRVVAEGSTSGFNPIYAIHQTATTQQDPAGRDDGAFLRDNPGSTQLANNVNRGAIAYTDSPTVLIKVDTGTQFRTYKNGVLTHTQNYTRGTVSFNLFCLFALMRANNHFSVHAQCSLYGVVNWDVALNDTQIAEAYAYGASLHE